MIVDNGTLIKENVSRETQQTQDYATQIGQQLNISGNMFISVPRFNTTSFGLSERGNVERFTESSGRRMRKYLRECTSKYSCMVTLTYPFTFETDGKIYKDHLRRFVQELKRENQRRVKEGTHMHQPWSVFWFMEFQERGAPHFHLFSTHYYPKEWVARKWYLICGTDDERHLRAGTRTEKLHSGRGGTISYASKYAAKMSQKVVPDCIKNCGRFWGVSGDRTVVAAAILIKATIQHKPQVEKHLVNIKNHLKQAILQGRAIKIPVKREKTVVVVFKYKQDMTFIRSQIDLLALKVALYLPQEEKYSVYYYPEELQDDICQSYA